MKWFLTCVIIAAAAVYFVFFQPTGPKPLAGQASAPAASTPAPAPIHAPPPAPAVPEKHIAPPGTWYLLQPVSLTTDSGVVGVIVGTKVTVVNDKAKSWRVTDGENQFNVAPEQLTNDLDVAAAVIQKEADTQAALEAGIHDQQNSARKTHEQGAAWLAKQLELQREQQGSAQPPAQPDQSAPPTATGTGGTPPPFGVPGP